MRILRRRLSLRYLILIGVFIIFVFFLMTIRQFDQVETDHNYEQFKRNNKFRGHIRKPILGNGDFRNNNDNEDEDDDNRLRRIERLKARVENKFNFRGENYDQPSYEIINEYVKAVSSMQKLVHLDLKGSPPKLNYLKELIPFIKKLGATGILIEYEDFFPYSNDLETIKNQNHYTKTELKQIFNLLKDNNLSLIPLIQTYGHLEFVLKLKQFAHLREDPKHYQVISPCLNASYESVLYKMIDQILEVHPEEIEYIHIGCDEVYHVNINPACKSMGLQTIQDYFIHHISKLVDYINKKRTGLKVMIWDDMIRKNMIVNVTKELKIFSKKIIPMVWNYKKQVEVLETWNVYNELFSEIWIASAFKGATSNLELIPDSSLHYNNHESWLKIIREAFNNPTKIKGITLTGWSRYDHMQAVCEILPASIPSLALSLNQLVYFNETETFVYSKTKELTKCNYDKSPTGFLLTIDNNLRISNSVKQLNENGLYQCDFPGSNIYKWILILKLIINDFNFKHQRYSSVLNKYSLQYKFFNSMVYEKANKYYPYIKEQFKLLETIGEKEFDKYFYADLFEEIVNVYILSNFESIDESILKLNKTLLPEFAPIRPFNKIVQSLL